MRALVNVELMDITKQLMILISARMVHASAKPFTTPFACNGPHTVQHGFGLHHINGMLALLIEVNTWRHRCFISSALLSFVVLPGAPNPVFLIENMLCPPVSRRPVLPISLFSFGLLPPGWIAWRWVRSCRCSKVGR